MIQHLCENCIYKVEPQSIRDYYLKTGHMPLMCHWGEKEFKHTYWLCSNPYVAEIDHTEPHTLHRECISYNFHGNCTLYRQSDAEDIIPSEISISYEKVTVPTDDTPTITSDEDTSDDTPTEDTPTEEHIYVGDEIELKATATPASKEAVTEECQKLDIDGEPLFDDDENPVMETVEIEPAWINDQDISYIYQWYKNGRKLFQKKSATVTIKMSEESIDEYYCVVTQCITNNGDGGYKIVETKSNVLSITVEPKPEEPETPSDDTPDTPSGDTTEDDTE